ncbi:lipopolysaccharide biosynthesis protein [Pedobacter sp. CCM 8938]|uniref:Lipopolysaccharide biosynthesis protein n=1 Tax=Pedobacter fastidiosus TaxID=2765361 RepID=A0ABR7KVJ5_9SPHI|nr:lipopolysaccharide biosynthesis protein [Pedobacter fastidiosus]MBC6112128.1 lipopolysaccharide biosynthesis protein [Pedobacter fastidiosus]
MDIKSFLKLVNKYKWVLILVPIIAVIITYFLVQNLPKQYSSETQISTGLLDPSKKVISNETTDFFKVSQQFSNIMEKFKMKKIINILSYNLILHDLEQPRVAFRKYSEKIDSLNAGQRQEVINLYKQKLATKSVLTLADNDGKFKLYDIIESMGYGEELLKKEIDINHTENSDYINVEYVSENPNLSAFVVNNLATEFITNYSSDVSSNQNNSIRLLDSVLKQKELVMNDKNGSLSTFKRSKGVLNLSEQSASVYAQISQYESQRADAIRQIQSNQGAIATIESKLRGSDSFVNGSSRADNREIVSLKKERELANNAFIENNFRASDQKRVDSLTRLINSKSNQNSDDNVLDPRTSKQALVTQKLNLEIAMQQAKSSMRSIDQELSVLRGRYSSMVPYDADIQNYEREADLATKEYMTALDQFNQNKSGQSMGLRLQIEQLGLPGNPEASKKAIYLAGSGLGSFFLCLTGIFLIFIADNKIKTSAQLANATKANTIGVLNKIESNERNIREIWNDKSGNLNYEFYRDMLRSLRFEISEKMDVDGSKILGITSLVAGEGKTFIAHCLAYAFAMTGKKVLLIADELPVVQSESKALATSQNFQTFLIKKEIHTEDLITIMNKSTARESLLETQSIKSLKAGFDVLSKEFDLIIVDVNALHDINIAKEWLLFTEKNISIFEYGKAFAENDREFAEYIKKLPGFLGWVLNKTQIGD